MRKIGRKVAEKEYITCNCCGEKICISGRSNAYKTNGIMFKATGFIPCCKNCLESIYRRYLQYYRDDYSNPAKKAIQKICMIYDLYFSDAVFESAIVESKKRKMTILSTYFKTINLVQYKTKTYDDSVFSPETIIEERAEKVVPRGTIEFFGEGFPADDYFFLQREYNDWITRNECNSKQQEEIFKNICFKQLELHKARLDGKDTSSLDKSFRDYLGTAGLQPKQKGQTISEAHTFGTLLDKWENEKPIPEPEEEFKDVDGIQKYVNVFYKYQLAKMHNIKIPNSEIYDEYLKKYTVEKPEEIFNEDGDTVFDAIFGKEDDV